jgi:hypothetical protein
MPAEKFSGGRRNENGSSMVMGTHLGAPLLLPHEFFTNVERWTRIYVDIVKSLADWTDRQG